MHSPKVLKIYFFLFDQYFFQLYQAPKSRKKFSKHFIYVYLISNWVKNKIWNVDFLLVEKEWHSQHHKTAVSPFSPQQGPETFVRTRLQPAKEKVLECKILLWNKPREFVVLAIYFDRVEGLPSALQQCSQRLASHGPAWKMSMLLCLCDDT